MHALHTYLAGQLAEALAKRRVVVFYDPRAEFAPFIAEVAPGLSEGIVTATLARQPVSVARFEGSYFALRQLVEPLVAIDEPAALLLYLPGVRRDKSSSVLMELEAGGKTYEPELKRLAINILRQRYTDGEIDELLASDTVAYEDIVAFIETGDGAASKLRIIYPDISTTELLARWLSNPQHDEAIASKHAFPELAKVFATRLGAVLDDRAGLPAARATAWRWLLINEFRADLNCPAPASIGRIPAPAKKDQLERVRELAEHLRQHFGEAYRTRSVEVETEMGVAGDALKAADLGSIDTFRFEERLLLQHAAGLIVEKAYDAAAAVVAQHITCFWARRDLARQAQWESCRLLAVLGGELARVEKRLGKMNGAPAAWVEAYTHPEAGWYRLDQAYRLLEAHVARMDEEPEAERALDLLRQGYERAIQQMATGFAAALASAGWSVPGVLPQAGVFAGHVDPRRGRTAYVIVDALRYEMGAELATALRQAVDLTLRPAIAALPTITPIGMAALLPGASGDFAVVEHKGKLAARIDGTVLGNLKDRQAFFKARQPGLVDFRMDDLLDTASKKLTHQLGEAPLVVVRSQEIDSLGESGSNRMARNAMNTAIGNVARAIRKLADAGIEQFVVVADHGHLFSARKGDDMKTEAPGGKTVELHRRCWAGHGGATPPGAVRVAGADLGYATDLEFIFPTGLGVFPAGGDLSYHHGGISLQEILVPVLTFRMPAAQVAPASSFSVTLANYPDRVTNRTIGARVSVSGSLFSGDELEVQVILLAGGEQVGALGLAFDAKFDRSTGVVTLTSGAYADIALILARDEVNSVQIVVQDPATGRVLAQSDSIPVHLSM
ncbi:MAG: PglZ domain-containing protein [Rhodothermales bacterium]|nr:PglZ domain-containing protein [Rhodothermales bacterium]